MSNVSEISATYQAPQSVSTPTDLSRQAFDTWLTEARKSGINARQIAGRDSVGVVEANGELYSLDLHGDKIEAHKLNMSKL